MAKELTPEILEAITIATRFQELSQKAEIAHSALQDVSFALFTDILNDEGRKIIYKAIEILEELSNNTGHFDARHYITTGKYSFQK